MAEEKSSEEIAVIVNPFYAFITDQHNSMIKEEFQKAKFYSREMLGQAVEEKLKTPLELFEKLWDSGVISEDNTLFLEQIYQRMENKTGLEEIETYKRKRKEYRERLRLLSVKSDSLFVGRDAELIDIMKAFATQTGKCCCLVLAGPPGIGKTKLSIQTCAIFPEFLEGVVVDRYLANLRGLTSVSEVGAAIMNAIGFKEISPATFGMADLLQWIRTTKLTETIIYLDNADDVLRPKKPSRDDFTNFLREVLQEYNQRLKFMITTRYRIDNEFLLSLNNFHQLDIKPLKVLDAMSLLRRSSELPNLDDEICKNLVFVCGHNPHAIRALASRLKQGQIEPKELLDVLNKPVLASKAFDHRYQSNVSDDGQEIEQHEGVIRCLRVLFDKLDNTCKKLLIKLTVFPSFFNRDVAATILGEDQATTSLYLQDLCLYGVLEFAKLDQFKNIGSDSGSCNQYNIHTLVRLTCSIEINENDSFKPMKESAMVEFLKYYHEVINAICELANKNFKKGLEQYQKDKINLIQYLEHEANIRSRETSKELDFPKEDKRYVIFDGLVEADRRVEYFEIVSRKAKAEEDWISYSFLCGWVGDQYICQAMMLDAHRAADRGLETLKEKLTSSDRQHRNAMIAKAACLYVKGRAYTGQQEYEKSLVQLQLSLDIRKEFEGDHTMTARALNAIGHVLYRQKNIRDSQYYHQEAWEMIRRITDDKPELHLDASVYVMNLGTCFRSWGNRYVDAGDTEKGFEQYHKALEWFNTALKMQQSSFPGLEIELTSKILKNRALCYFEMEDYLKALPDAEKSLRISQRILKENPDTARCLYFVGTTHHHIGKKILTASDVKEEERSDANNHFGLAMKYFKEAYDMEDSLGPHRRSIDFLDLKDEILDVLKTMGEDEDATVRWEQRFAKTDEQDPTEVYHTCYEKIGPPIAPPGAAAIKNTAQSSTAQVTEPSIKKWKPDKCYIT